LVNNSIVKLILTLFENRDFVRKTAEYIVYSAAPEDCFALFFWAVKMRVPGSQNALRYCPGVRLGSAVHILHWHSRPGAVDMAESAGSFRDK
jgi:hypothetical protein